MINKNVLDYRTVTKALEDGEFYSSTGPEIDEMWVEDGILHLTCPPAKKILFQTGRRSNGCYVSDNCDVTKGEFKLRSGDVYVRATVFDEYGNHADTNAYFIDELIEKE